MVGPGRERERKTKGTLGFINLRVTVQLLSAIQSVSTVFSIITSVDAGETSWYYFPYNSNNHAVTKHTPMDTTEEDLQVWSWSKYQMPQKSERWGWIRHMCVR